VHDFGAAAIGFIPRAMLFDETIHGRFENMNDNLHCVKLLMDLVIDPLLE
jgi:hypothetical protein